MSLRNVEVFIDDVKKGEFSNNEDFNIDLKNGSHTIYFKVDFVKSKKFDIKVGEEVNVFKLTFYKSMIYNKVLFYGLNILLFVSLPFLPKYENLNFYFKLLVIIALVYLGYLVLEYLYYITIGMKKFFKLSVA